MAKTMKRLLPCLREKKRYLVFKVLSNTKMPIIDVLREIKNEIVSYFGQKGLADAGVQILKETYDIEKQSGIIRVGNKYVNQLKTALMLITMINEKPVLIKSITVSGIIDKAKKQMINL
ncbi:hypothetical protein J4418_04585 [Candidatus Woesearchaeota archaeon]|nr:hypothetical protein [Candidatus Woesearchaeota archaeon]